MEDFAAMRLAARVDANQKEVVTALRKIGASVLVLSMVGKGCPDLLVGFRGKNFLMEVKDGSKPLSQRALTDDEDAFLASWKGVAYIVYSAEQAIKLLL
jgi:hypothetical protein